MLFSRILISESSGTGDDLVRSRARDGDSRDDGRGPRLFIIVWAKLGYTWSGPVPSFSSPPSDLLNDHVGGTSQYHQWRVFDDVQPFGMSNFIKQVDVWDGDNLEMNLEEPGQGGQPT